MSKIYNRNWNVKKLSINFNQKQWRQDFGAFIRDKLFWPKARVTRALVVSKGVKEFQVYNGMGSQIFVQFENESTIISTDREDLIYQYFEERGVCL